MPAIILYRAIKFLKIVAIAIMSMILLYLFFALTLSIMSIKPKKTDCLREKYIYLTTNGVHLDIIIPYHYLDSELQQKLNFKNETLYFGFGWGDKEFFYKTPYWSDLKFKVAFKALFLKSGSAMHITVYSHSYNHWRKIFLCNEQLIRLNNYIKNSFKIDSDGRLILCPFPGYSENDIFYEAKNNFSLFRTCNVWVNNAFKIAGIKTSVWSPFDFGVLFHTDHI
jgi:uncharacterized protein (TIGR02117 family)